MKEINEKSNEEIREKPEVYEEGIIRLSEIEDKIPKLEGVSTGIEGLDELFFKTEWKKKKPFQISLGGIPRYSIMNLTGVSDTGKSLMVEQYAIKQAGKGEKVAFITVESPAAFVAMGMKERAKVMGIEEKKIDENIIFIDAASHTKLREDLPSLLTTLAHVIKTYRVNHTIIDSITGLYEHKEMMARIIVRRVFNFLKKWYQTALLVSQKRSGHELMSAEAAGGYAVGHIVDGTMVLYKETIDSSYKERLYGLPIGEIVRLFRIDGCRLTGHDTYIHLMEITEKGLVKIGPSLLELLKERTKAKSKKS